MTDLEQKLIGVIINPYAKKNQKDPRLKYQLQKMGEDITLVRESQTLEQLDEIAREFIALRIPNIISFGGDGTYQRVITAIIKQNGHRKLPYILSGNQGTMNYTAKSADISGTPYQILDRMVEVCRSGEQFRTYPFQTLKVRSYSKEDPEKTVNLDYGFVFGAAGVSNFLRKYYGQEETQEARKIWSSLSGLGSVLEDAVLGTDFVVDIFNKLFQQTVYTIDKPGVIKVSRIVAKGIGSFVLGSLGFSTKYHHEILDPEPAKVIADGEILPQERYNVLLASSLKINVVGTNAFHRLNGVNHDGRIHLYAGNEPYLNLVLNFFKTFSPKFKPHFENMADRLVDEVIIKTPPGFLYNLDAEMKESAGTIRIKCGPVIEVPQIF